ncbi:MAG: response regulator transcription factor [bacterium]
MKLLLIEDNQKLIEDVSDFLKEQNYVLELANTLEQAREKFRMYEYDLAILDLGLPDGNGMQLISEIKRHQPDMAILILTATHSLEHKVEGLNLGADDYLTKPFHKAELNARIRSILRRKISHGNNILQVNEIQIDISTRQVRVNDKMLNLTRKEYDLLLYLIDNETRLLTKENIAEYLWGDHIDHADNFDFIYNHIKNLRRKLLKAGGYDYIQSVYGVGYKFKRS